MIAFAERRWLPDWVIRAGIRRLLNRRLRIESSRSTKDRARAVETFAQQLRESPIAVHTDLANEQHYEVPAAFFDRVLGPHLKYSCGWWETPATTLAESERAMLQLTVERADIEDGMQLLDIGCGWGSLSLYLANAFPNSEILGVSNSSRQREFILARAAAEGLSNLDIVTADIRDFSTNRKFDRALSIEMFEHMRNYERLLQRVTNWLTPAGKLFVHVFCHRDLTYTFDTDGDNDWMARHFFTGGLMPSADLFSHFDKHLRVARQWHVNGGHYASTCEAWLDRLDSQSEELLELFSKDMPVEEAEIQLQRWRMFFMACAELFRFGDGDEWFVAHYLFGRP